MYRLFCLLLLTSTLARAEPAWDWSEPVQYRENHDPGLVTLIDGREVHVEYTDIPWKVVDRWESGKALILGYRAGAGVVLLDPANGKSIPVLHGLGDRHPIDLIVARCRDQDETTSASANCYVMGREHWDKELNRAYAVLLASLDEKHREAVRISQRQWLKFRDAELAALGHIYDRSGTMWLIVCAQRRMELIRERALRMGILYSEW